MRKDRVRKRMETKEKDRRDEEKEVAREALGENEKRKRTQKNK